MATISLCMIVKNEEATLPRCLESVQGLVEEVVIVDTGSSDRTREIAGRYTPLLYDFPWEDDFAAARNFAFSKATQDYCLWLDADDVLLPQDRQRFLRLKASLPPDTDVVMLPYHTGGDGAGRPGLTYFRERLLRREAGFVWEGAVHEAIAPAGKVLYGDAAVTHKKTGPGDPDRNLRILENVKAKRPLLPREQFYYARELAAHGREEEAAGQFRQFLDEGRGWVENEKQACLDLAQCLGRLGRSEEALAALLRGLRYGPPGGELCCALGDHFLEGGQLPAAVFWYEAALSRPQDSRSGGFLCPEYYGYYPCLQLCVCWYRLGDPALARAYNRRAAACHPDSAVCRANEAFFASGEARAASPPAR